MAEPMEKQLAFTAKASSIDAKTRRMQATISTKSIDRDGDIIETRGIRLGNYMKNPVVLWAHDRSKPPIAKAVDMLIGDDKAIAELEFAKTPFADEIFYLYENGFLNAWSIGFRADEKGVEPIIDKDGRMTGYHIISCELMEFSAVPVPANAEALVRAAKSWTPERRKMVAEITGQEIPHDQEAQRFSLTYRDGKAAVHDLPAMTESKHTVTPGAFRKSITERGAAGKIPVTLALASEDALQIKIEFEIVKQHEEKNEITEARILSLHASLPSFAKDSALANSRAAGAGGGQSPCAATDAAAIDREIEDTESEILGLAIRAAGLC